MNFARTNVFRVGAREIYAIKQTEAQNIVHTTHCNTTNASSTFTPHFILWWITFCCFHVPYTVSVYVLCVFHIMLASWWRSRVEKKKSSRFLAPQFVGHLHSTGNRIYFLHFTHDAHITHVFDYVNKSDVLRVSDEIQFMREIELRKRFKHKKKTKIEWRRIK